MESTVRCTLDTNITVLIYATASVPYNVVCFINTVHGNITYFATAQKTYKRVRTIPANKNMCLCLPISGLGPIPELELKLFKLTGIGIDTFQMTGIGINFVYDLY